MGHQSASTVVCALQCKECGGSSICEHGRLALSVQGVRWGINLRARSSALSVQGVRWVHQSASTVVSALVQGVRWVTICEHGRHALSVQGVGGGAYLRARSSSAVSARSARSSERIINQITTSQSVLVPSPFTRPPPPPFLHKSLSHHEAGSKITVAEVQSTRRWPLQQTNTTQGRARLPPLEATMEAFRRQVSGTGAKKKKPEPVTRDAYGFVVRNPNP